MTATDPTIRALVTDIELRCAMLDVAASVRPDGADRLQLEETAATGRARALVIEDRAARDAAERWAT